MPRQNRVTPFGQIMACPDRGTFMGNRGRLHDEHGHVRRAWCVKRWLVCVLEFRGRKRTVMAPDRYTELFFLDEATALAAGHRPCAECRHGRFLDFCDAWRRADPWSRQMSRPTADEMDERLHADRLNDDGSKRSFICELAKLPDGTMIVGKGADQALLVWGGSLLEWSPGGYRLRRRRPRGGRVRVLTPRSMVNVIRAGYVPTVHVSAGPV